MANSDRFLDLRADNAADAVQSCPKCRSVDVSSAAKHPTVASYWRCAACGQVWSPRLVAGASAQGRAR